MVMEQTITAQQLEDAYDAYGTAVYGRRNSICNDCRFCLYYSSY